MAVLAVVVTLVIAAAGTLARALRRGKRDQPSSPSTAYILENTISHARLLPEVSAHAFRYPTLAFLLSLDALESHKLDLARGWLFGYGGTSWRVTGLRSGAYLLPGSTAASALGTRGLKAKLADVLELHGLDKATVQAWVADGDAWMLTMPSYLGYEGINPLTVYFCYDSQGALYCVVLEIHNTFGEKHVHVLRPGVNEDSQCPSGFNHAWTFQRDFHVSPFNDRSGSYSVSLAAPHAPHSPLLAESPPQPKIRIHLHTEPPATEAKADGNDAQTLTRGLLKLTATLAATRTYPLSSAGLLYALAGYPFALLLSFARILYHAWILHYVKRLNVFPRPDPKPAAAGWRTVSSSSQKGASAAATKERVYGGVGWPPEGALEKYARHVVERFLARRADELGIVICLRSGDPSTGQQMFSPLGHETQHPGLAIHYTAPRFFSTLLLAPSAQHMLLLGRSEDLFRVDSEALFLQVFSPPKAPPCLLYTQKVRTWLLPRHFLLAASSDPDVLRAVVPRAHPLDESAPLSNTLIICAMHMTDMLEKAVFTAVRARFVPGLEPWGRWDRAARAAQGE
ncbi:hypothetical protein C8Q73DRAFT_694094 [Cubamyces lactineus]|nr:hypothetical protein C8Q73DRAFT_694094 [Cubamyces lactineus]